MISIIRGVIQGASTTNGKIHLKLSRPLANQTTSRTSSVDRQNEVMNQLTFDTHEKCMNDQYDDISHLFMGFSYQWTRSGEVVSLGSNTIKSIESNHAAKVIQVIYRPDICYNILDQSFYSLSLASVSPITIESINQSNSVTGSKPKCKHHIVYPSMELTLQRIPSDSMKVISSIRIQVPMQIFPLYDDHVDSEDIFTILNDQQVYSYAKHIRLNGQLWLDSNDSCLSIVLHPIASTPKASIRPLCMVYTLTKAKDYGYDITSYQTIILDRMKDVTLQSCCLLCSPMNTMAKDVLVLSCLLTSEESVQSHSQGYILQLDDIQINPNDIYTRIHRTGKWDVSFTIPRSRLDDEIMGPIALCDIDWTISHVESISSSSMTSACDICIVNHPLKQYALIRQGPRESSSSSSSSSLSSSLSNQWKELNRSHSFHLMETLSRKSSSKTMNKASFIPQSDGSIAYSFALLLFHSIRREYPNRLPNDWKFVLQQIWLDKRHEMSQYEDIMDRISFLDQEIKDLYTRITADIHSIAKDGNILSNYEMDGKSLMFEDYLLYISLQSSRDYLLIKQTSSKYVYDVINHENIASKGSNNDVISTAHTRALIVRLALRNLRKLTIYLAEQSDLLIPKDSDESKRNVDDDYGSKESELGYIGVGTYDIQDIIGQDRFTAIRANIPIASKNALKDNESASNEAKASYHRDYISSCFAFNALFAGDCACSCRINTICHCNFTSKNAIAQDILFQFLFDDVSLATKKQEDEISSKGSFILSITALTGLRPYCYDILAMFDRQSILAIYLTIRVTFRVL